MKKKRLTVIVTVILIMVLADFIYINIYKSKVIGTWSDTDIDTNGFYYTQQYIFEKDGTLTQLVLSPDGTIQTNDLGKYWIVGNRILYKNERYELGFGVKYHTLQYSFKNDVVHKMQDGYEIREFERAN